MNSVMKLATVNPRRSALMSRIRMRDTKPELVVRKTVHRLGYRFRIHKRDLVGKPDLVFSRLRKIIFVHGCFWHQHAGCKYARKPKTGREYWLPKLAGNVARDRRVRGALQADGWRILTLWECELRDIAKLEGRLARFLSRPFCSNRRLRL